MAKNESYVVVSCTNGPGDFYVLDERFVKLENQFKKLIHEIGTKSSKIHPALIKVGEILLAKPKGPFKEREYFRIKTIRKIDQDTWLVFYIDYGQFAELKVEDIRASNMEFMIKLDGKAKRCKLDISDSIEDPRTIGLFNFLVGQRRKFIMKKKEIINDVLIVDLQTWDRVINFSISDFLVSTQLNLDVEDTRTIKNMEFSNPTLVKVKLIKSPLEFYLIPEDMEDEEKVMKIEMDSFYEQDEANFTLALPGMIVVVCDDDHNWHRVEVLENNNGQMKVQDIDKGNVFLTAFDELFELHPQFYDFPRFARKFSLAGVNPEQDDWMSATEQMQRRLIDVTDKIEVNIVNENEVDLYVYSGGQKYDICQLLNYFGHIKSNKKNKPFEAVVSNQEEATVKDLEVKICKPHPVDILSLHRFNPLDFVIIFKEFKKAAEIMQDLVQRYGSNECVETSWGIGDKCLIRVEDETNQKILMRAEIIGIKRLRANLRFLDVNKVFETNIGRLKLCPPKFKEIGKTYQNVKLACQLYEEIEKFTSTRNFGKLMMKFDAFQIEFMDDNTIKFSDDSEPRPALLFGRGQDLNHVEMTEHLAEKNLVKVDHSRIVYEKEQSFSEFFNSSSEMDSVDLSSIGLEVIDNFTIVNNYNVNLERERVKFWKPAEKLRDRQFIGKIRHIDKRGIICIQDINTQSTMKMMEKLIFIMYVHSYKGKNNHFVKGDPCIAYFNSIPKGFYRAKIIRVGNEVCDVEFVDYGTDQVNVKLKRIHPRVICHEIPVFQHKFRLRGSIDENGNEELIDDNFYQKLFVNLVEENVTVKVLDERVENGEDFESYCEIEIGSVVLKSYDDCRKKYLIEVEAAFNEQAAVSD